MAAHTTTFDAVLEPLSWGRNVYTIFRVPSSLAASAAEWPTRRVEGYVDGHQVNVGLNRSDVIPDTFVYAGSGFQKKVGVRAGDIVRCQLWPVDPDVVPVADDVRDALAGAGLIDVFDALTPGQRRRLLVPVDNAVRADTRARRIDALVRGVAT